MIQTSNQPDHKDGEAQPPSSPRVSILAVAALAMSVIGCCPVVSAVGSLLGVFALKRIRLSNGALRGRRIANLAVLVGVGMTLVSCLAWWRLESSVQVWMDGAAVTEVERFVRAAQAGDASGARASWISTRNAGLDDQSIMFFGQESNQRYGALKSFRVTSAVPGGTALAATREYAGTFTFERAELPGAAGFMLVPSTTWEMPRMRLHSIAIDDGRHGDLAISTIHPAAAGSAASQPSP